MVVGLDDAVDRDALDPAVVRGWSLARGERTHFHHSGTGHDHRIRPRTGATRQAVYCCSKALLAVAALRAHDRGQLSIDEPVGDVLAVEDPDVARAPIRALMSYGAEVESISPILFRLLPESMRRDVLRSARRRDGARYSEIGSFGLVALALEARVGPLTEVLGATADAYGIDLAETGPPACTWSIVHGTPLPLLGEELERFGGQWLPELNAQLSPTSLCRILDGLYADANGAGRLLTSSTASLALLPTGAPAFDPVLGRDSSFTIGLWHDMAAHGFGDLTDSVGIAAQGGVAVAVLDLRTGATTALTADLSVDHTRSSERFLRLTR